MSKIVKYVLLTLISIIVLVSVALAGIVLFVDPNDFKDDITAAVHKATGRDLTLAGDIELSVFPWLGVSLGAAQLSNAQGFGDTPFASVQNVDIKVKLLPLFKKQVEMQTVRLHGLHVQLARRADGRSNWDDLTEKGSEEKAPVEKPVSGEKMQAPLMALAIGGLDIVDARLEWDDRLAKQRVVVNKLSLATGPVALNEPVDIKLGMDVELSEPVLNSHVDLAGTVAYNLEAQQYRVDEMTLAVRALGDILPVSPLNAALSANVQVDLAKQQIAVNALHLTALDLSVQGQLGMAQFQTAPAGQGKLTVDSFSPRDLMAKLGINAPETADSSVMTRAKLAMEFKGSADAVILNKLALVLDDTTLTGTASVENFQKPVIEFDVLVDEMDADRYLPPKSATPVTPETAAAGATQLPLEMLRQLNVAGQIKAGKLKVSKARVSDVVLGIKAAGGQIRLHPAQANLYQGSYSGNIGLDVRSDTPKLSLNEKLDSVAIGPLLKDVMDDELVSGTANVAAILTANGVEPDSIMKSLDGTASFSFLNGAVKGINLGQMIREAYAKIKNQPAPPKTTNQTDFAEMSGSVTISKGVVKNEDLKAKTPLLRIGGKGIVDLPKEKIDYLVSASIVESAEGQAGKELSDLKALTIPVKVTGSFSDPKFSLDLKPILDAKVKAKVEEKKEELKQKVDTKVEEEKAVAKEKLEEKKEVAKDKLKDKLKKLF